jgi:hypothetical protein
MQCLKRYKRRRKKTKTKKEGGRTKRESHRRSHMERTEKQKKRVGIKQNRAIKEGNKVREEQIETKK